MTLTLAAARAIVLEALADVAPEIDTTTVSGATSLTELDLDSMDQIDLLAAIEGRTGRTIPDGVVRPEWGVDALADHLTTIA